MKFSIPTPNDLEPIRKMKPLSSFVLMVSVLMILGMIMTFIAWKYYF